MARSEARLQFGCWRSGLAGHSAHAKLVYAVVLTEPTLSQCGVGAMRIARWAKDASLTVAETQDAVEELCDGVGPKLVVDEDTEEVFVRTLIRNDRVAEQPYVLKGALREALLVESPAIRRVLAAELRKLPPKQPDSKDRNGRKVTYPDPHATAAVIDPSPPPEPTRESSETLSSKGFGEGFETVSDDFGVPVDNHQTQKGSERPHGGGDGDGGGGGSTPVGGSASTTAARKKRAAPRQHQDTPDGRARAMVEAYALRNPLCPFMGVLKLVKKAMAHYDEPAIRDALNRLADAGRPVTGNALLVELEGPDGPRPLPAQQSAADRAIAASDATWDAIEARHGGGAVYQLPNRSQGA